jgi:membrane associated rhomboid family serine protease
VDLGAAEGPKIQAGQWWRLFTCTFLHGGLLHIGMNMYGLYVLGTFAERIWGRWRLLLIYLIAGWAGSCLAMAYPPTFPGTVIAVPLVGASGAICGILGALVVWVLLAGKHLPAEMARRLRNGLFINVALLIGVSLLPMVSWQGHLGGGLGGAAAALVLHFQRFGKTQVLRWAAALALLPLPIISFAAMQYAWKSKADPLQAKKEKEKEEEEKPADKKEKKPVNKEEDDEEKPVEKKKPKKKDEQSEKEDPLVVIGPYLRDFSDMENAVKGLLAACDKAPADVKTAQADAKTVKAVLAAFDDNEKALTEQKEYLETKPSAHKQVEQGRKLALEVGGKGLLLCRSASNFLKKPTEAALADYQQKRTDVKRALGRFQGQLKKLRAL